MFKDGDYWTMTSYFDFESRNWRTGPRWKVFALLIKTRGDNCVLKGNGACHSMRGCVRQVAPHMSAEEVIKVSDKLAQQWAKNKLDIVEHYRYVQTENEFTPLDNYFDPPPTKQSTSKSETIKEEAVRIIERYSEEDALEISKRIQGFCYAMSK